MDIACGLNFFVAIYLLVIVYLGAVLCVVFDCVVGLFSCVRVVFVNCVVVVYYDLGMVVV